MSAIHWRGVLLGGLFLAAQATTVAAQERELLTLEAALARAGIVDSADEPPENPRLIGPRAEADAARALVDQARLRPNPEIAFEAENIAGSGAFSGLQATEYTLSLSQRLELGGKRGARVRAAQAEGHSSRSGPPKARKYNRAVSSSYAARPIISRSSFSPSVKSATGPRQLPIAARASAASSPLAA